jgi:hypothetical protein
MTCNIFSEPQRRGSIVDPIPVRYKSEQIDDRALLSVRHPAYDYTRGQYVLYNPIIHRWIDRSIVVYDTGLGVKFRLSAKSIVESCAAIV